MTEAEGGADAPLPIFDSCNITIMVSKELPLPQAREVCLVPIIFVSLCAY